MNNVYEIAKKYNIGITEEIVSNLASVFFSDAIFNLPPEIKNIVISIYKILDFNYIPSKELLLYKGPFNCFFVKNNTKNPWKITPYRLNKKDIKAIEDILNNYSSFPLTKLCPLFDSIGFILKKEEIYKLYFIGSANYEIWKEVDPKWNEDINMEEVNWKDGEWLDGIDLNNTKFNWKPEEDIYGET